MGHSLVADVATVLGVAALTGILFRLLRQPPVLGYLLAGLLVGPYLPFPLFADLSRVQALADLGVILVMFCVGLELSVSRLLRLLPTSGLAAAIQISGMAWAGWSFARWIDLSSTAALFVAGAVAISSTMVVSKVLEEHEVDERARELVFGVLVVQDVVAIGTIAVLTGVASGSGISPDALVALSVRLGATLVAMLVVGLLVVPRLVRLFYRIGSPEMLVVAMAGLAFGVATLAATLGYSVALGAFLAGTLVAESGRGREVEHLIVPLKHVFAAIFFVSIGMLVDPLVAWGHLGASFGLAAVIIVGQLVAVTVAGLLGGNGLRRSVQAGTALGQIGEFGFIIVGLGVAAGVVPAFVLSIVITTAVLTAFSTSILFELSDRLAAMLVHRLPRRMIALMGLYEDWLERLHTDGIGAKSKRRLRRRGFAVLLDAALVAAIVLVSSLMQPTLTVWSSENLGLAPYWGKAAVVLVGALLTIPFLIGLARNAKRIGLELAERLIPAGRVDAPDLGNAPRRMIVVTVQLSVLLAACAPIVALTQPVLPAGVGAIALGVGLSAFAVHYWRSATHLGGHVRAATEVLFDLLRQQETTDVPPLPELLPGLDAVEAVTITADGPSAGKTLGEIDLTVHTGAAVLAISRATRMILTPAASERLEPGDVLALVGPRAAVSAARDRLEGDRGVGPTGRAAGSHPPPDAPTSAR